MLVQFLAQIVVRNIIQVCMHLCIYGHTYKQDSMDQPGKVGGRVENTKVLR